MRRTNLDWQDINSFYAVLELGSFAAAGRALGVDHVTVSRRVTDLEAALGVRLLNRLPRRAVVTEEARALAVLTEDMAQAAGRIWHKARGMRPTLPDVRLSVPSAFGAPLIAPRIPDFEAAHPETRVMVTGDEDLERRVADITVDLRNPSDRSLVARRIGTLRLRLYGTPARVAERIPDWRFIGPDRAQEHLRHHQWLRMALYDRRLAFRAADPFAQLAAARAGVGIAILPDFVGDADPAVVRVEYGGTPITAEIWISSHVDMRRSAPIRAVTEFVAETVAQACPL